MLFPTLRQTKRAGHLFRDKPDIVPIRAETVNNLLVDAFVRNDSHPAIFSEG
jgi:hypothetical protein